MPEDAPSTLFVVLADEVTSGQIAVTLDAYAEFCLRLDLDLDVLVTRFAAFATPGTAMVRRSSL